MRQALRRSWLTTSNRFSATEPLNNFFRNCVPETTSPAVVSGLSTDAPQSFILTNWQAHMTIHNERRSWQLQLLSLPCVLLIGALVVYPALYSIYLILTNAPLVAVAAANPRLALLLNSVPPLNDRRLSHSLAV